MKIELRSRTEPFRPLIAPTIPGLTFRKFNSQTDYQNIADIVQAAAKADGIERADTVEDITRNYSHLHNCDLEQDMIVAEVEGQAVGYARVWWELQGDGAWMGFSVCFIKPEYRRKGLGTAFLAFNENRLRQIALQLRREGTITAETPCWYDNFVSSEKEPGRQKLLEKHGYTIVRAAYDMVRPDLENIPAAPMPAGLIVRTATRDEYRQVWEASNEAFRDHWGYIPDAEEYLQSWYDDPKMDPTLWRVAWDGNEVAGMVLSFIDENENREFNRKRGYTENICVRRPYRRQGLARSLIVQSLHAIKERGMTEAALGVDAENVSGALHLYESCGFQVKYKNLIYRKQLTLDGEDTALMTIRAVIFDLGGVLVRTDNQEPRRRLAERYGMTYAEIDRLVFDSETAARGAVGDLGVREHWNWLGGQLGLSPQQLAEFEEQFWAGDTLDLELVEFIRSLRPRYKTGLLSNAWDNLRETLTTRWGILDIFDEIAISAEIKMVKPDPRTYAFITARLGVAPAESIFVDDMPGNIAAAEAAGLQGVRFITTAQTLADIRARLLE